VKYKLNYTIATIDVGEYIQNYCDADKFIGYCKQCERYNACWACPPFDFAPLKRMENYKNAHIIGTKIILDVPLLNECTGAEQCKALSYKIIEEVRHSLDNKLLELEQKYRSSLAFFAGTCHLCKLGECMRILGKPCLHPAKIRHSLEAFGFDISKTVSQLLNTELKWGSKERLPEYFVLVSGFFTNEDIVVNTDLFQTD
jgi:predicted metal-binding protein